MSGKVYRSKDNNEKLARRKGHYQRTPTESNSDVLSTINTTVESFNAFGINESVQLNSSENDLPLRSPFAKNTLPADLLARQLAQVVEHQPQLSSEEKVHIWRWEAVVSPVEDVHNFEELFEQREATLAANLNKNKRRIKTKTKKYNKEEMHYNFKEFRERLEKDLLESVKVRNILQFSRFKAAVRNLTTNATRKRSTKTDVVDTSEEPKTKIRKKLTKVDTATESNKQLNKLTPNKKQQQQQQQTTTTKFVVNIKPMTKRQDQIHQQQQQQQPNEKPRQNAEKAKEVEETNNNKHENSLIVFREDFTNKTLHLDKKRAEIFKNVESNKTTNNNNNINTPIASDNEQISATNNETNTTTTVNDNSTIAGVFHQQHVFCNYLGLTGMSTANALATAAAELSNCATRRFSLRVRQNQQKEKKQQQQKLEKAKPTPTDNEISKRRMSTSKQPPKIVALDIKKAKEISDLKTQNLLNLNSMRAKLSVCVERRDPVPVRIVHRYSSICEERPKPVESSNVFMLPKLQPPTSSAPRKPIFSAEFINSLKPKITPVSSASMKLMENKKLNFSTKFLMPKTNNLITEQTHRLSMEPQTKCNLMTNDLTPKTQHAESEQKSQLYENCVLKEQPLKAENKVEITSIEIMKPATASNELKHESTFKAAVENRVENAAALEDFKQIEVSTLKAEISRTEQQPESETETTADNIVEEEKPLIEINSNLNINQSFESENDTTITVEAIQALTENDIIFADDFLMTVENANDTNKIISNNNGVDLIEKVEETDVREQFVPFINNIKNVQDCLPHEHENENSEKTKLDESSNINNMHSVDPLHNDISTNNLVNELPLILCHEKNSQENQITETTVTTPASPLPQMPINTNGNNEMFLQQGSIVSIVPSDSNDTEMCTQQAFSNNVAVLIDNKAASEENVDKNADIQNVYKNVQYFHNISTKETQNPLIYKYGKVLYMYYELDVLLVVQELMISFWKCSKLLNALKIAKLEELEGNKNEWLLLDVCPRSLKDIEIPAPYSSRICIYNGMTHYCELRGFHVPSEEHFFSLYVNVYFYNEEELQGKKRTIVLDSVKSIPQEITYITLFESHYIVFCWSQIVQEKRQKTGMCKYSLAPHFERIACIRDFKELNQHIKHLECINDKLYGYGETTLTVWDHRSGDVFMNFDFQISIGRNIGSIYYQSPEIEQDNMMLLFQHVSTSTAQNELLLIMCSVSHITPSYRILKRLPLPMPAFQAGVSSAENNGEHIMIRAKKTNVELWISCADPNTMLLMPPQKSQCFYVRGRPQVINVTENSLTVDTIINHLLKLQAVDNSLNGHHLSTCN